MKNVCVRCGKVFEAKSKLAKYCPECKRVVRLEAKRKSRMKAYRVERKKLGKKVKPRKTHRKWQEHFSEDWLRANLYD